MGKWHFVADLRRGTGLLVAAMVLTLTTASAALAQAPAATQFRAVAVDTRPLAHRVGPHFAQRIEAIAVPVANKVFADRITGKGPLLVLRYESVKLTGEPQGDAGGVTDHVRGEALVVERNRVIARHELRAAPSASPGFWPNVDIAEQQRYTDAVEFFTRWMRREMGL
jgi:hypothetical protein